MIREMLADGSDRIMERTVAGAVTAVAENMLVGTSIALPDVGGGALQPVDVTPEAGGRYLIVQLR